MVKQAKFFLLIFTIPLFLSGCFSSDDEQDISTKKIYETESFSIMIPQDWDILEKSDFTSNVPPQTIAAFRNNIKSEIFNANVSIALETASTQNVSDHAKINKANAKASLVSFQEIRTGDIEISYGNETIIGIISEFQGKKSATDPIVTFKQLNIINGEEAYTITGAHLPDEDETVVKYIDEMLNSFSLK